MTRKAIRVWFVMVPLLGSHASLAVTDAEVLAPHVIAVLERSCAQCHDAASARRVRGDFDHVLDVGRMVAEEWYVVAGRPDQSELYRALVTDDPDRRMPPADSDAPALTIPEVGLIHAWILAIGADGADGAHPESKDPLKGHTMTGELLVDESGPAGDSVESGIVERREAAPLGPVDPWRVFVRSHPIWVHFPIALLLLAAVVEVAGLWSGGSRLWAPAVSWALWIGTISAAAAALSGWWLADLEGYRDETVRWHRWSGVVVAAGALIVALVRLRWGRSELRAIRVVVVGLMLLLAIVVMSAGHSGGELVWGAGYPFR